MQDSATTKVREPSASEARVMLEWQIEMGATEAIGDVPVNRYDIQSETPKKKPATVEAIGTRSVDPVAVADLAARAASDLEELRAALAAYPHCDLKKGARNLVFSDGLPLARLMVIGEAPGREEDIQGKPFVGRAGQLLDLMFRAIGLGRDNGDPGAALYITNVLPWRPPQNRDPSAEEMAMMLPFLKRHVALAAPEFLVLMGNHACQAVLGRKGITKLRGNWTEALGLPVMPMFHPAYLLRNPAAKREAWADLLALQARLKEK